MQRLIVPVSHCLPSPLKYSVWSELGRGDYWGCMEQILTRGHFDQGSISCLPGHSQCWESGTLSAAGREAR